MSAVLKIILLFIISLIPNYINAQNNNNSKKIKKIVNNITHVNQLKCESVGHASHTPAQYIRFDSLKRICTDRDLLKLTNHRSAVVRVYAFWAASERPSIDLFSIIYKHRNDFSTFHRVCGCYGSQKQVIPFMFDIYKESASYKKDTLDTQRKYILNKIDKTCFDHRTKRYDKEQALRKRRRSFSDKRRHRILVRNIQRIRRLQKTDDSY